MNVINYFSLDIFQRLQHWKNSEDVNKKLSFPRGNRKPHVYTPERRHVDALSPGGHPAISFVGRRVSLQIHRIMKNPTADRDLIESVPIFPKACSSP